MFDEDTLVFTVATCGAIWEPSSWQRKQDGSPEGWRGSRMFLHGQPERAVDPLGLIPLSSSSLSCPSSFPLSFSSLLPPTPFLPSPAFP